MNIPYYPTKPVLFDDTIRKKYISIDIDDKSITSLIEDIANNTFTESEYKDAVDNGRFGFNGDYESVETYYSFKRLETHAEIATRRNLYDVRMSDYKTHLRKYNTWARKNPLLAQEAQEIRDLRNKINEKDKQFKRLTGQ